MSADLKECPFCGSAAMLEDHRTIWRVACASLECGAQVLGDLAPEPDGSESISYWADLQDTAIDRWNARAIAPPVAAGSVDTLQRFYLVESQHGTGYMAHWDKALEEDADGEWVKHADAIAWGAQKREQGKMEAIATLMPRINHHSERAEKAEAELETWAHTNRIDELQRSLLFAGNRIQDLESQLSTAKPYDLKA